MAVRAEYRETGLEERMVRHLLGAFVNEPGGPRDALVYVGAARVPVMASVRAGLGPVDEWLR
jgi:ribosomal protein S18 acetylase RimI-like enzyme